MVRTQIQLTEEQHRRIKAWARERGISFAEAIRRCVTDRLAREEASFVRGSKVQRGLATVGKYADPDGTSRVALEHDDHLAGAFRR